MSKRAGLLLFAAFAALFLTVNRDAYRGYFQDDEIDNLSWTPYLGPLDFLKGAVTPQFQANNFRPVGHYYFHAVEEIAGLDFPVYVAVLQAFHLLNVWLLWLVARRLGRPAVRGRRGMPVLRTAHGAVRRFLEADVRLRCALRHLLPAEPLVLRDASAGY